MVPILKELARANGNITPDDELDKAMRESWRKWGNGKHWDFPHECKRTLFGDSAPCTCGHPHAHIR